MPLAIDIDFSEALPKAELHAHLSGSIRRETLHEIWLRKKAKGDCNELEDPLTAIRSGTEGFVDIATFFPLFDKYIYALCNDVVSVKYATEHVIRDFQEDGVRYLELRTTPRSCVANGMQKVDYVEAVGEVVTAWNRENRDEIEVYLILSIDRGMTAEQAMEVADLAVRYQYREDVGIGFVVGVDLCGNPTKGNVSLFKPAFEKASAHELGITCHFAEIAQSATDYELDTILSWHPQRLGHCIKVSPKYKDIIQARGIGLELCLSCNVLAGLTSGGFSDHHLGEWLQRNCPIALSTDDVGIFGSPLSREYEIAARHFLASREDVMKLSRSAVDVAFAGKKRMTHLIDQFERDVLIERQNLSENTQRPVL